MLYMNQSTCVWERSVLAKFSIQWVWIHIEGKHMCLCLSVILFVCINFLYAFCFLNESNTEFDYIQIFIACFHQIYIRRWHVEFRMHPWGDVVREANVPWGINTRPNWKDYGCHFSTVQRRWVVKWNFYYLKYIRSYETLIFSLHEWN